MSRTLCGPALCEAGNRPPASGAAHRRAPRERMQPRTAVLAVVLGLAMLLEVVQAGPTRREATARLGRRELSDNDRYTWIYAVGDNGKIMTSRPGESSPEAGKQWEPLESGSTAHLYDVMFSTPRNGIVVGAESTVLTTTTMGSEWEAIDLGLPSPTNLYGVFIMVDSGPTYIVGDKGLFIELNGDGATTTSLSCSTPDKDCTEQEVTAGWNSNVVLTGARFRDPANGVIVGTNGTVIIVRAGQEAGSKTFTLLKPVQVKSSGLVGPRFPDFLDVVSA